MVENANIIESEIDSSEQAVKAVRNELPVGVAATPIDRIPLNSQLVFKVNSGVTVDAVAGTHRCIRVIEAPVRGGGTLKCHCSRPCVSVGTQRLCPEHDKAAFQPSQTPHGTVGRVTNSASVPLTNAEMGELAKVSKSFAAGTDCVPSPAPAPGPIAQKPGGADVTLSFTLAELSSKDLLRIFAERARAAVDGLPCTNLGQMKQMVAVQEKIAKLCRRRGNDTTTGAF